MWDRSTFEQHSVAVETASLLPALCWQPNGRHIFTAQKTSKGSESQCHQKVLLYERNGLAHGGFDLLPGSGDVAALRWSPDSELLAVLLSPESEASSSWTLQVWHRSNWHWYLKQERRYDVAASASRCNLAVLVR